MDYDPINVDSDYVFSYGEDSNDVSQGETSNLDITEPGELEHFIAKEKLELVDED